MAKLLFALAFMALVWWFVRPKAKARALPDTVQARSVLGVAADATADDIRAAHRRLLSGVHPDKGGSAELTRQINAARDVLLTQLK